ncbi:MAG: LuxE/PaaK family acyltransferase [Acidobacteriota bacterium]
MFLSGANPFGLPPPEKEQHLTTELVGLLAHHRARCAPYARIVADWERQPPHGRTATECYPFVPVTVFKEYDLRSVTGDGMSVRSSSTTGKEASRIFVDKSTKKRQTLSASRILSDFIGANQRPYLVFDQDQSVRGIESMSARGAAILSLAPLASELHFVMRETHGRLVLDRTMLERALQAIGDRPFIAYGFTYVLFQAHQEMAGPGFTRTLRAHPQSVLLHSGGWKRMTGLEVSKPEFNRSIAAVWGLGTEQVIDFYGTVEQVGMPYPDCAEGSKHVPYWGDIIVRRADTLQPACPGEVGLIQLLSCVPLSAPNHSVLTEDLGEIVREDGCPCGRRGKAFRFRGRAPKAEIRGCSDAAHG